MMSRRIIGLIATALFTITLISGAAWASPAGATKPSPDEVIQMLKAGNARFVAGTPTRTHRDQSRLQQAGTENQGNHAYATVIACSDSRVPVEILFDAGIVDVFVIRVAGNVVRAF